MTKTKSTKKALLMSAISMLLCFTMLLGTTFAWFTDSVTSSNNIIKSGNLDVVLEYATFNDDGTFKEWKSVQAASDILTNELWEPGVTEVAYFRIANEGSLAFKYQFGINIVSETEGVNQAGESFKLSDYIQFGVVEGVNGETGAYADRDAAIADVTDAKKISAGYAKADTMVAGADALYLAFVVYMPTSVGNEANHNGTQPKIELGINVAATQVSYEEDSYGDDYDANLDILTNGISRTLADGSNVLYYNEESGYAGRVRLIELPENIGNEYVVPAEVNDLGGSLVGATLDKLTVHTGVENAYKSLEGATIGEVVIEDGATTIPNRMFYKANVGSVVIPSTVTVIEQNAFAQTAGVTELVIPASVTTVEEAAFQHMTDLVTVTFEGDTAIQGYAFRGCAALRTVHLKGEDVTFIASTLNNRNSTWFCNGESNNPNTSDITFYVENETVAARVKTAMGAEANNTKIYVDGKITVAVSNSTDLKDTLANVQPGTTVDATGIATTVAEIATSNAGGRNSIEIGAGTTIKGLTLGFNSSNDNFLTHANVDGGEIVFENCTFTSPDFSTKFYLQSGANTSNIKIVFNNCTFVGPVVVADNNGGGIEFNNCTFNLNNTFGYVQCMGGNNTFNSCAFNYAGAHSGMFNTSTTKHGYLNMYSERYSTVVTTNQCTGVPSVHKIASSGGSNTYTNNQ